jgi:hypothetical protein
VRVALHGGGGGEKNFENILNYNGQKRREKEQSYPVIVSPKH